MANRLTTDFIERFDEVFSRYMAFTFYQATEATWRGDQRWRNHCHRAAKIAARALDTLLPNQSAEAVRVQLKARMEDGESYVDLGNPADPPNPR
ncbi:hypothetical protein [Burkholderia vietnamiensis]|uniref:hypothetical protein n=1 Tax=Burkholderia vietnamiensis TaxID=60552 RepID=UPI00159404AE|nr:hypothetical protein [Burkholderia vietnamiensis]